MFQTFPSSCFLQDSASAAEDSQSSDRAACKHAEVAESNTRRGKNRRQREKVWEAAQEIWREDDNESFSLLLSVVRVGVISNVRCCCCCSHFCPTPCAAERPGTVKPFTRGKVKCEEPPLTHPSPHTTSKPISFTHCTEARTARSCRYWKLSQRTCYFSSRCLVTCSVNSFFMWMGFICHWTAAQVCSYTESAPPLSVCLIKHSHINYTLFHLPHCMLSNLFLLFQSLIYLMTLTDKSGRYTVILLVVLLIVVQHLPKKFNITRDSKGRVPS